MDRNEALTRNRARALQMASVVIVLAGALDWLLAEESPAAALAVRLVWAAGTLWLARLTLRLSPFHRDLALLGGAVLCVSCWLALALLVGGPGGPYFWWMLALPLIFAALAPDNLHATTLTSVGTVGGNAAMLLFHDAAPALLAAWVVISGSTMLLATTGVLSYRRLLVAESESQRSRLQAERELAESEQRRLRAEKLALIGKLAAGIAHEVNNPLAYVKANVDLLRDGRDGALDRRELDGLLEDCRQGITRIEEIVQGMRSFAHVGEATVEPCELEAIVGEAVRIAEIRTRPVAQVEVRVADRLPTVTASRTHLVQALVNLLVNAADALGDAQGPRWIRLSAEAHGEEVVLEVADSGPGIAPEHLEQLFDPFFTTKPEGEGTGLGLSLVREFVERYGGSVAATNEAAAGACFRIRLPADRLPCSSQAAAA